MKRCLYCLLPHSGRGRCCSTFCARKVNGKAAWVTKSRRAAARAPLEAEQLRLRHRTKWRKAAMGDPSAVLAIFGTAPDPAPHRHGEYLDAT